MEQVIKCLCLTDKRQEIAWALPYILNDFHYLEIY